MATWRGGGPWANASYEPGCHYLLGMEVAEVCRVLHSRWSHDARRECRTTPLGDQRPPLGRLALLGDDVQDLRSIKGLEGVVEGGSVGGIEGK